jgi:hypothetical protein
VLQVTNLTLIVDAVDIDNNISSASFYREADGTPGLSAGDVLVGSDTGAPYFATVSPASLMPGTYTYYARVTDAFGGQATASTQNTVENRPPAAESLSVSPDPAAPRQPLTLTANGVSDPDRQPVTVQFYSETNGVGGLQQRGPGADTLLGSDSSAGDGYTFTFEAPAVVGSYTWHALPVDSGGSEGTPVSATGTVAHPPPSVASLADDPDPQWPGGTLTLTAGEVVDPSGLPVVVEFYLESNNTVGLQTGVGGDALLGSDGIAADGYVLSFPTTGLPVGTYTYYARPVNQGGVAGAAVSTSHTIALPPPSIVSLSDSPDPIAPGGTLTLTAVGVTDPDGAADVASVSFYRESNGTPGLQTGAGGDALLATDGIGADGYALAFPATGLPLGVHTYYARAVDQAGGLSNVVSTTNTIERPRPTINSLSDSPDPAPLNGAIMLTAVGVFDRDGPADVASVSFFRETDGFPGLDAGPGGDTLLGTDNTAADGYRLVVTLAPLPAGTYTYYAQAVDQAGGFSNVVSADNTVSDAPPNIGSLTDSPDPVAEGGTLTLTAVNVTGPGGMGVYFYREQNNVPGLQPDAFGGDSFVGWDSDPAGGYSVTATIRNLADGPYTYYAQAINGTTLGNVVSTVNTVSTPRPTIASLTDSPDPAVPGAPVTLTANGVAPAPGGSGPVSVSFYQEANIQPGLQTTPFGDFLIGTDSDASDGYSVAFTASTFPGHSIYYAVAAQSNGVLSEPVMTTHNVSGQPDRYEVNNTFDSATDLGTVASRSEGTLSLHVPTDNDFFRFTAANTGTNAARLLFASYTGKGLARLTVYDSQRQPIATQPVPAEPEGDLPPALLFQAQQGQTYYLGVDNPRQAVVPSYTVSVSRPATIGGLSAATNPSPRGAPVSLTATGVSDPDGDSLSVQFFRESNGTPGLQVAFGDPSGDTSVAHAPFPVEGVYKAQVNTRALEPGQYTYYAVAADNLVGIIPPGSGVASVAQTTHTLLDWQPTTVAGRHIFYWKSVFHRSLPNGEDFAVAADKQPLRPGQGPATFQNITSYSRGINGVMIDFTWLPGAVRPFLFAEDFDLAVSDRPPAAGGAVNWAAAPVPQHVVVRPAEGAGGADRVELIWPDGAIKNQWLRVTVKANERTGLSAPDVFYYGNLVGETGVDGVSPPRVTLRDLMAVRSRLFNRGRPITDAFDIDRNGRIDAVDVLHVRRNLANPLAALTAPPAAPAPSAGTGSRLAEEVLGAR